MSLVERLQLIVDATAPGADETFRRLSGSAQTADRDARTAGQGIVATADRVAAARGKEVDAAGNLHVAETRLDELRKSGRATATQLARAEVAVERAQRQHHGATRDLERATAEHEQTTRRATTATSEHGRQSRIADTAMRGLAAGAAAFVGIGLVDYLRELPAKFAQGARDAGQLARSMNATTEQGGAFLGLVGTLGLDLNDLLEIQAEFAQKVDAQGDAFRNLGAQVERNADGTVNWSETLVSFLGKLQGVEDATERNRLGFAFLGEEGYKQLSKLVNSGVDVRDALEQIGTPFTQADIAAAAEYDAAMRQFTLTTDGVERSLGRALLPALSSGVELFGGLVDVVTSIPAPLAIATGAAVALGITGFNPLAVAGARVTGATSAATAALARFRVAAAIAGTQAAVGAAGMSAMSAAGGAARRAMGALGGPLGVATIGLGVGVSIVQGGVRKFEESARNMAVQAELADRRLGRMADSAEDLGAQLADNAGVVDGWVASIRGADQFISALDKDVGSANQATGGFLSTVLGTVDSLFDLGLAEAGATAEIEKQRKELGALGVQQQASAEASKTLTDLIGEGTTSGREFGDAVAVAADAQAEQERTSGLAEAAIAAYNAVTREAVQAAYDLITARYASENAEFAWLEAMDDAAAATDDSKTSVDEYRQAQVKAAEAALNAASSAADAAVQDARTAGKIVDAAGEASIRGQAMVDSLRAKLDTPGLGEGARQEIQGIIDQLVAAQERGDIEAVLSLTGAPQVAGELDKTTEDRDATVKVESRGGPAVDRYLDGVAAQRRLAIIRTESRGGPAVAAYLRGLAVAQRMAIIRVESRGGPAVADYLDRLRTRERLAIIRVESRGGPAVDGYLGRLARERLAIIRVESRNGPNVDDYLDRLAARRTAIIDVARGSGAAAFGDGGPSLRGAPSLATPAGAAAYTLRTVELDLRLTGSLDRGQVSKAERGRAYVADIRAYEQQNGAGWRRTGGRS